MIRRPPRSTPLYSSAASDVYKRQSPDHSILVLPCGLAFRVSPLSRLRGTALQVPPPGTLILFLFPERSPLHEAPAAHSCGPRYRAGKWSARGRWEGGGLHRRFPCLPQGQRGGGARSASPGGLSLCRFHGPAAGFPPCGNAGGRSSYLPDRQGISQYLSLQHLLSQYPQAFVLALSFSRYPVDEEDEEEEDKDPCHGYQQQEDAAYEGKQILKEANEGVGYSRSCGGRSCPDHRLACVRGRGDCPSG